MSGLFHSRASRSMTYESGSRQNLPFAPARQTGWRSPTVIGSRAQIGTFRCFFARASWRSCNSLLPDRVPAVVAKCLGSGCPSWLTRLCSYASFWQGTHSLRIFSSRTSQSGVRRRPAPTGPIVVWFAPNRSPDWTGRSGSPSPEMEGSAPRISTRAGGTRQADRQVPLAGSG